MSEFPNHIFKAYDIRGKYPAELDAPLMKKIGAAYVRFLRKETKKEALTILVCQDMRDSSPELKAALIEGVTTQGADVIDIGLASTPTFYIGVSHLNTDGGVQVTASHNPYGYNGCKMVRAGARPISGETGLQEIRADVEQGEYVDSEKIGDVRMQEGILDVQIATALEDVDLEAIKPYKIVVDPGNGMGALGMKALFHHLPCTLDPLYFDLDGTFPNHESNPLIDENNADLQARVVETGADIGIALDGDGDRVFFVDETGRTVPPAIIRGILSKIILEREPGSSVAYDIRPGRITLDMIMEYGGEPVLTKVGHSLIKERAAEEGCIFAGESSGHFFHLTSFGFFEYPELTVLWILEELSKSGKTLSEYIAPLDTYAHSGEINFSVDNKQAVFDRLIEHYAEGLAYDFDGVTFEFDEFWFNVRASNTEEKVRLNMEGYDEAVLNEKVEEVSKIIRGE